MKMKLLVTTMAAAAVIGGLTGCKSCEKHESEAELQSQAKISKDQATQTALAKVPSGTIKEAELEKEKGKLIWSFDVATPDTKDITEVNVDAVTGEVVSVEKESAAEHAKEEAEDAAKEKKDKD